MGGRSVAEIDLKAAINAVSDVIQNRPRPLRTFDQIYMKELETWCCRANLSRAGRMGSGLSLLEMVMQSVFASLIYGPRNR